MDMTRSAMEYIVENSAPIMVDYNDSRYTDKPLTRINKDLVANELRMTTLTSLIDYIRSGVDGVPGKSLVHVVSPTRVTLISPLNQDRKREMLVQVDAEIPDFDYGTFIGHESFLIALQAKFMRTPDLDLLLKFAGTVESGTVAQYGDDGVSQKATVKSGISSKADAIVPNPVKLIPYRTFLEVDQPESSFVFRMKDDDRGGVRCAIFEADGGAWKRSAMDNVADFIRESLDDLKDSITVIC